MGLRKVKPLASARLKTFISCSGSKTTDTTFFSCSQGGAEVNGEEIVRVRQRSFKRSTREASRTTSPADAATHRLRIGLRHVGDELVEVLQHLDAGGRISPRRVERREHRPGGEAIENVLSTGAHSLATPAPLSVANAALPPPPGRARPPGPPQRTGQA